MADDAQDIAFARYARVNGVATPEQIALALQTQSRIAAGGRSQPLSEIFVRMGLLDTARRAEIEKSLKAPKAGGQRILHYKLLKKLGEGGMGAVYLAEDERDGLRVALKVLPRRLADKEDFVKRFRREAEAAAVLEHPHIVRAFFAGEDSGWHFYVMEYCEGETLDRRLSREKSLPVALSLDITRQAAEALHYAHGKGFIHRDIKPSNILLTKDGRAKILDLGLSRKIEESQASFMTVSGAVMGTPHYISPEQAKAERDLDGRTDLYSLGATLYHFLTGSPPYAGASAFEIVAQHVNAELPNPLDLRNDIPDGAVQVLRRMMAKDRADRYPDGAALAADLERVARGESPSLQPLADGRSSVTLPHSPSSYAPTLVQVAGSRPSKRSWLLPTIGAAVALAVAAVAAASRTPAAVEPKRLAEARPDDLRPPLAPAAPPEVAVPLPPKPPTPDEQLKQVMDELRRLNPEFDGVFKHEVAGGAVVDLEFAGNGVSDIGPLRSLKSLKRVSINGRWNTRSPLSDLSPLEGLELRSLSLVRTSVARLESLRGMPLDELFLSETFVRDFAPLAGKTLSFLELRSTKVADLSVLKDIKIGTLILVFSQVRDLSPLAERKSPFTLNIWGTSVAEVAPLKTSGIVALTMESKKLLDLPTLRDHPTLRTLNNKPAAEFWKAFDRPPEAETKDQRR